ncbi:MAG TPA: hypothetical protein VFQ39_17400 [Longimicrobium sp.]|nr:hypothetical protein [Longimicrobium sp.]
MPVRRTIRKPTRWTPEEWRRIEDAARERGVPPLRYVREAALAGGPPPRLARRAHARHGAHELGRQLKRVLNNLHQLARVADDQGAAAAGRALASLTLWTEQAVKAAAVHRGTAQHLAALTAEVVAAGRHLNEVTHGAHLDEALPSADALREALTRVFDAVHQVLG